MSMISYSSNSIFCEDSKYAIRIDMQALVLHLLKIENANKSSWKRSNKLKMSQGSILYAQNYDLRLGAQPAKNRKYLHDPRKKCHRAQNHARTNIVCSKLSCESPVTVSQKVTHLLKIAISLQSMWNCASSVSEAKTTTHQSRTCL